MGQSHLLCNAHLLDMGRIHIQNTHMPYIYIIYIHEFLFISQVWGLLRRTPINTYLWVF